MLTSNQWGVIDEYIKLGITITEISRRVGVSKPTIYERKKELNGQKIKTKSVVKRESERLKKYELFIKRALRLRITNMEVMYNIVKREGYEFSYDTFLRDLRKRECYKKKQYKPSIKRHTDPGEEAQVDWGYYGKILADGKKRKIWFFVYVLGYCRCVYIEFTVNTNRKTLIQCHINAFRKLGVPKKIAYDNMKTVFKEEAIRLDNGEKYRKPSPEFLDFARCFGFEIFLCHPYHPRSKGKVEGKVKFAKNNFVQDFRYRFYKLYNKDKITLDLLNQEVKTWVAGYHKKVNDETHKKPNVLWREEKHYLHFPDEVKLAPLLAPMVRRKVSKDGYIVYKNFGPFQLDPEYIEEYVDIKETNENGNPYIEAYFKKRVIAKFLLSNGNEHKNLLAEKKEKEQKSQTDKKQNKARCSSQVRNTSIIPSKGYYQPEGYYKKFIDYN